MNQWPTILLAQVANVGALAGALCFQNFVREQRRPAFWRIMRMVAAFAVGFVIFDIIRFRNRAPISGLDFILVLGSILLMEVIALYLWHRPADGYFQRTIAEQPSGAKQPGFLWQGILILLPVLVLAVAGVWTLRQDRATVESQARNRAETLAATALADIEGFLQQVISATDRGAPAGWTMRTNLSNFILNSRDQLSSPPPLIWPPVPSPLPNDLGTVLKSNKVMQWRMAEEAFAEREWERAAKLYFDFLDRRAQVTSEPMADFYAGIRDRNFRPRALFNRGFAFEQQGATNLAIAAYNDVLDGFNISHGGVTESGLSLCALAALRVLELAHDDPAQLPEQWQHNPMGLVTMLDNNPSPFDTEIHARLEAFGPALARTSDFHWTPEQMFSRWGESDANRRRYAEAAAQLGKDLPWPSRFWVDGEFPWLAVAQAWPTNMNPTQGERWIIAFPKTRLEQELAASIRRQGGGEDFAARAEISGRVVGRREEGAFVAHVKSADGNIVLSVSVGDPPAFFAAQARRQWLFGGLLLVAAASCVIGYFAARRAYFRQLRLNEMKSNFVSSVSHELRAPIASVRLMAEGLEGGRVKEPEKQHEYFGFIVQECRRLSSLIENVLDFSRIEQGRKQYEMEPTDFAALVERTVKLMETYAAERQVNIALQKSGEPVPVDLDGKAMQQAIINLVDNAIKHSPKGAEITVGLEFARGTNQPCSHEHGHVEIWVEDKGEGIPAVEHERIFERFYRVGSELRRETQGVGIGLSIVKHIVEAHGGKVTVRSAPGQGSRFTIELPLKPQVNESVNQRISK